MNNYLLSPLLAHPALLPEALQLYEAAFPPAERRTPTAWQEQLQSEPLCRALAFVAGNSLGGFLTYWDFDTYIYIEHLAVAPQLRGHGIGARMLGQLAREQGRPIVLEVEPPADEMSRRRVKFYERLGFRLSDFPYLQPPYSRGEPMFELRLMLWQPEGSEAPFSFEQAQKDLYHHVYRLT